MNGNWGQGIALGKLSATDNIIGYAGYIYNAEFPRGGLYTVRHRHYSVDLGRWISRDPAGYVDGWSLYQYGVSSPLVFTDPYGLDVFGAAASWAFGGGWNEDATLADIFAGTDRALLTGAKATGNAIVDSGASLVTLGQWNDVGLIPVNQTDLDLGYDVSYGFSRVGAELATGIVTGGLSTVSKAGKVIAVVDAAGNLVMVGEGVAGAFDCDGWTAGEIFGTLAALAGLGGNAAGALGKWASKGKLAPVRGGAGPVRIGQAGERVSTSTTGLGKNTTRIPSASGQRAYRVPDQMEPVSQRYIVETKNVNYQTRTSQLLDDAAYVTRGGVPGRVDVHIDIRTDISLPLLREHLNPGSPIRVIVKPLSGGGG